MHKEAYMHIIMLIRYTVTRPFKEIIKRTRITFLCNSNYVAGTNRKKTHIYSSKISGSTILLGQAFKL